jgi:hypothetical protein
MHTGARLVIACSRPGLIRGGVRHPKLASYPLGHFAEAALREMLAEPELALVLGTEVTVDMLPSVAAPAATPPADTPPARGRSNRKGA